MTHGGGPDLQLQIAGRPGACGGKAQLHPPLLPRHPQVPQVPQRLQWELQALPWQLLTPQMVPELLRCLFLSARGPESRSWHRGLLSMKCASFFLLPCSSCDYRFLLPLWQARRTLPVGATSFLYPFRTVCAACTVVPHPPLFSSVGAAPPLPRPLPCCSARQLADPKASLARRLLRRT